MTEIFPPGYFPGQGKIQLAVPYPFKITSICQRKGCYHACVEHFKCAQCSKCKCTSFIFDDRRKCEIEGCVKKASRQFELYWNEHRVYKDNHTTGWYASVWSDNRAGDTKRNLCEKHGDIFRAEIRAAEDLKKKRAGSARRGDATVQLE